MHTRQEVISRAGLLQGHHADATSRLLLNRWSREERARKGVGGAHYSLDALAYVYILRERHNELPLVLIIVAQRPVGIKSPLSTRLCRPKEHGCQPSFVAPQTTQSSILCASFVRRNRAKSTSPIHKVSQPLAMHIPMLMHELPLQTYGSPMHRVDSVGVW